MPVPLRHIKMALLFACVLKQSINAASTLTLKLLALRRSFRNEALRIICLMLLLLLLLLLVLLLLMSTTGRIQHIDLLFLAGSNSNAE